MKPKEFIQPYTWEDRRPHLFEKVFFVPEYYSDHDASQLPPLADFFGNDNPIHLEYCSGNGEWIADKALENPDINWIGVEIKFERVRQLFSKRHNREIDNLLIVCGEAHTFTREYLPDGSLDAIYINFPDPWPKGRHAKHRLVSPAFAKEVSRALKKDGTATLVTDDKPYFELIQSSFATGWTQLQASLEEYGSSFFDRLWRSLNRTINIHHVKNAS